MEKIAPVNECMQTYRQNCRPLTFADPWGDVASGSRGLVGPDLPDDVLVAMAKTHSEESLLAAGIAQRGSDGTLSLHSFLARPRTVVMPASGDPGKPAKLLTDEGWLPGEQIPLLGLLEDPETIALLDAGDPAIVLTADLSDTALLQTIRIAAAPVYGLDHTNPEGDAAGGASQSNGSEQPAGPPPAAPRTGSAALLDLFAAAPPPNVGTAPRSDDTISNPVELPSRTPPSVIQFVLAVWGVAALSREIPAQMQKLIDYFRIILEIRHHPKLRLIERMEVWNPTPRSLALIQRAVAYRDPLLIIAALRQSLSTDRQLLSAYLQLGKRPTPETELADAWRELSDSRTTSLAFDYDGEKKRKAHANVKKLHRKHLTGKLLNQAQSSTSALEGTLYNQLAMHSEIAVDQFLELTDDVTAAGMTPEQRSKRFDQLIANSSCTLKIANGVIACKSLPRLRPNI